MFMQYILMFVAAFLTQKCRLENRMIKFEIWDTAGQERFHSLAPMYYRYHHTYPFSDGQKRAGSSCSLRYHEIGVINESTIMDKRTSTSGITWYHYSFSRE